MRLHIWEGPKIQTKQLVLSLTLRWALPQLQLHSKSSQASNCGPACGMNLQCGGSREGSVGEAVAKANGCKKLLGFMPTDLPLGL